MVLRFYFYVFLLFFVSYLHLLLLVIIFVFLYISTDAIIGFNFYLRINKQNIHTYIHTYIKTGTTFAILSTYGKYRSQKKKKLNKSASCIEISFLRKNNILQGILFGPEALLELREDTMLPISSLLVGFRNIALSHPFLR